MLDEAPETLVYSAIEGFETQPDVDSIGRINENGNRLNQSWKNTEKRLENMVSALEAELNKAREETERQKRPTKEIYELLNMPSEDMDVNDAENHEQNDSLSLLNAKAVALDRQKFSLAKQILDIESSVAQMRATSDLLDLQEAEIEQQRDAALASNVASNMNLNIMKVMLYKKFGIHIEEDTLGGNDKILIFSENKKTPAKVLEVDQNLLDYFISSFIWDQLGNSEET